MALKVLALLVALIAAWFMIARPLRALTRVTRKPSQPPAKLEACPRCGVYRPAGGSCDCGP